MDTTSVQPIIRRFVEALSSGTDQLINERLEVHKRRKGTAAQLLQLDHIPSLAREELEAFMQDMDTWYGLRWRRDEFWRRVFGEGNQQLPALRQGLEELVRRGGAQLTAADFVELHETLHGFGPAYLSEVLALRFPDRYWLWNKQIRSFFEAHGLDVKAELPWGKKGDAGEEYMAAGRHLADLRRALSQAAGHPVDHLVTDLFVYWANQLERPDRWIEQIARLGSEHFTPERARARQDGEAQARDILQNKAGHLTEADLRRCMKHLNADWRHGNTYYDRFVPALYGHQIKLMVEALPALNRWVERLWQSGDAELDSLLDAFWQGQEVAGAGVSLPTAVLYLRHPEQYNIWLPVMSKGLQTAASFQPGRWRTAGAYRRYNAALIEFRERYRLAPQALDVILWGIVGSGEPLADPIFPGFSEDAFRFLEDLAANNSTEWMQQDGAANLTRYRHVLREPLRLLFETVAPAAAVLDPALETDVKAGKVLASIRKRFPDEEGPYHTFLWGAFYRKGRTRRTDAQLFVEVSARHVSVGLAVGASQGSDALARFRRNLQQAPEVFLRLLQNLRADMDVAVPNAATSPARSIIRVQTPEDVQRLVQAESVDIWKRYEAADPILTEPGFAAEVAETFEALYPLFVFATMDDPQQLAVKDDEEDEIDGADEGLYTLDALCRDTFLDAPFWSEVEALLRDKRQIILYGPPGTGKTWVARQLARYWVDAASERRGEVQVVQFHPSYAYEEFVEGIRPQSVEAADGQHELTYPVKKGIFRRLCEQARAYPKRHYVLILDEINRGELPRILGELLYLLEYRQESVELPYSGESFAIPDNVYLIGTMNTADRSIALVDHALRRRFHFVALRANPDVLRAYYETSGDAEMAWVADLLEQANHQLEQDGVEWHLHIGHSHFMRPDLDEPRLLLTWKHSVLPTLEEYFYRQPERLQAYQLDTLKQALGRG